MEKIFCPHCLEDFTLLNKNKLDCGCVLTDHELEFARLLKECTEETEIREQELLGKGLTREKATETIISENLQYADEKWLFEQSMGLSNAISTNATEAQLGQINS